MVKVLTRGGQDLRSIRCHLEYLDRNGKLNLETDDGQRVAGKGVENALLEEWNLDLEEARRRADLGPRKDRRPPKLVHKILFSMPPGTPPEKVLLAVKNFAREEFGLKQRYLMVLHTDEPHPHVHLVVKAMSEQGLRMNIKRATLRDWRRGFARCLRQQGVAANATEGAVRGRSRAQKTDGIFRATLRGASTHIQRRTEDVASEISRGRLTIESGRAVLARTRNEIEHGWRAVGERLVEQGLPDLAVDAARFLNQMRPLQTEREAVAASLLEGSSEILPRDRRTRDDAGFRT